MCGIAGILARTPDARVEPALLRTMAAQLVHRGPDDEGSYVDPQGRCGFGFRRLSVIDIGGGRQPLSNEDGTVWVVFNGEVYNFRGLRTELQQRGHVFRTQTDTEVIVHLYEEHGEGCFERLAGMFALALWDERAGRLLLARDRFGKKPLIYAEHGGCLYFASEVKAILALPGMPHELDPQSLHRYLIFQYVPSPHSIYRGFRKLPPGHFLDAGPRLARATESALTPRPYWQLAPAPFVGTYADARARLGELLTAAVERRLIADVPLGAFLSGGIDSSAIVALMRQLGVSPLRTFSIGFADPRYDETRYARAVAQAFQTEHHAHLVTPQAREILPTLAHHYDEPFADSSAIPTYYVSRWTRQAVTVALTGDGGDEAFAGYDRYRAAQLAARLDCIPRILRRTLARIAALLPHARPRTWTNRLNRFAAALAASPARRYLAWVNVFPPALLGAGYREDFAAQLDFDEPLRWFEGLYHRSAATAAEQANRADIATYLPDDLLVKVDVASMACSLECRSPLLDHELVEFTCSLPLSWRLDRGVGKRILRDWARDRLPAEVLHRPKMGFGVPVGTWFRAELRDLVRDRLLNPQALCGRVFRREWLRSLVEAHISGRANYEHPLWALLTLELWHERWQPTWDR
jgi:asparagine synthase (glutamine-hydrolysing)